MSAEGREPVASCHRDEEGLPVVQLRGEIEAFHADWLGRALAAALERWDRAWRGERVTIVEPVTGPEDVAGRSRVVRRSLSPVRGVDGIPVGVIRVRGGDVGRFRRPVQTSGRPAR